MLHVNQSDISFYSKCKIYPDDSYCIMAANRPIFKRPGWEAAGWRDAPKAAGAAEDEKVDEKVDKPKDTTRARRRARAAVKDICLCTEFKYFVTLTLDPEKIDRYDPVVCTKKLNQWLDNHVRRNGLTYVIVPEYHKDEAIHYHGFFNGALDAQDSGTIIPPEGGKPRKPRSKAQRREWLESGGRVVYNLPQWTYGFTSAIGLYGDYAAAVNYVCKYISKSDDKIGGRWYYSGGRLGRPEVVLGTLTAAELAEEGGAYVAEIPAAGLVLAIKHYKEGVES